MNKSRYIIILLFFWAITTFSHAATYNESFSTNDYCDPGNTTADWNTSAEQVQLQSSYQFSQPAGIANWGGQINAVAGNGSTFLIGGDGAKLNHYNGTSATNLSPDLPGFAGNNIRAIAWGGNSEWYIV
ncbi:hypothetical protein K8S19_13860, partial [bacterium]|nr:hypothetical protein [bacterium]